MSCRNFQSREELLDGSWLEAAELSLCPCSLEFQESRWDLGIWG